MKTIRKLGLKLCLALGLTALSLSASAEYFTFSYTFDASVRGTPGHVLSGVVEGTLLKDGDTIVINDFIAASLAGFNYNITADIGIRSEDPQAAPVMSLSGNTLNFWVCVQGFTDPGHLGGGDCPFGNEGGFLISDTYSNAEVGSAWAGIPDIVVLDSAGNNRYRDIDIGINRANWSAEAVGLSRVSFSYMYDANIRGVPGHVLAGEVEGILLSDADTLHILSFKKASLDGISYKINKKAIGIRAANMSAPPRLSISGNMLDFWVCPQGFTTEFTDEPHVGGDCPFGAEGGFFVSDNIDFAENGAGESIAGIPELGGAFRDFDSPLNRANWSAVVTKTFNPKKPNNSK